MKSPEGQRRVAAAEERVNRSIAEHIEHAQAPHVHGGGGDDGDVQGMLVHEGEELKF